MLYSRAAVYNAKNQITSDASSTLRSGVTYTADSTYSHVDGGSLYYLGAATQIVTVNRENGVVASENLILAVCGYSGDATLSMSMAAMSAATRSGMPRDGVGCIERSEMHHRAAGAEGAFRLRLNAPYRALRGITARRASQAGKAGYGPRPPSSPGPLRRRGLGGATKTMSEGQGGDRP